jgi:hypothetical protein
MPRKTRASLSTKPWTGPEVVFATMGFPLLPLPQPAGGIDAETSPATAAIWSERRPRHRRSRRERRPEHVVLDGCRSGGGGEPQAPVGPRTRAPPNMSFERIHPPNSGLQARRKPWNGSRLQARLWIVSCLPSRPKAPRRAFAKFHRVGQRSERSNEAAQMFSDRTQRTRVAYAREGCKWTAVMSGSESPR